ncbi:hypothetical protein [Subtercola sp. RTI3]|uniref:hypothetical protein n=1 Tax=Subtercola sp. RTI3 TaxID=3048639 RepID=UPI002B2351C4|nr:hypothetical protein [Subtercola sp. RTI3]MEA9983658.1 hypothetical protein [Subtercola sp. RTI3]
MSEFLVDFPTLGDLADAWITRHCRVPNGFTRGKAFEMADWQFWCTANRYRIRPESVFVHPDDVGPENPPLLNQAFVYRQTLIVAPQKTGKGPWSAAQVAFEACGPSVFGGWAVGGEMYVCSDHGCPCGWGDDDDEDDPYVYAAGDPIGMRHPSPLIQITANSEDQADNIYRPLRAMIKLGPLSALLAVREGFIRILSENGDDDLDRIDVVTASANSRLGNPISDAEQDEVGLYTKSNKMIDVAETQRRGAAGMGGRTHGTTNAWDPALNSYAQQTYDSDADDCFIFYRDPDLVLKGKDGKPLVYARKADRQLIHEYVYAGSWWVDLASIEAEAAELMKTDPAQAERFFGNRVVSGSGVWMPLGNWDRKKVTPIVVEFRTKVCGGFDGSDNNDWTGIRLETLSQYQFTPTYDVGGEKRPTLWDPKQWGGRIPRSEVMTAFEWLEANYQIVRFYMDPQFWETEADMLGAKFGEKKYIKWPTNQVGRMHGALERIRTDVSNVDSLFTHDGDEQVAKHVKNAVTRARPGDKYIIGKPDEHRKIDQAMSGTLAHEATLDAIADGETEFDESNDVYY